MDELQVHQHAVSKSDSAGSVLFSASLHADDTYQVPVSVFDAWNNTVFSAALPCSHTIATAFLSIASLLCLDMGEPLGFLACPDTELLLICSKITSVGPLRVTIAAPISLPPKAPELARLPGKLPISRERTECWREPGPWVEFAR